jgi:protein SEY1
MCRGKNTNALVMDVEGTDGRERGEDQVPSCDFSPCFR